MDFRVTVLGSGSSGNAVLFSYGENGILVDAGFSRKEILKRLKECEISPSCIKALLITHDHSDHVKGARVLADFLDIPTYATRDTAQCLLDKKQLGEKKVIFNSGSPFDVLDFNIQSFRVSHDAVDPVGFVIKTKDFKIGIAMDLGHLDNLAMSRLKDCDALLLESNYDLKMLRSSNRPLRLIRRIAGKLGHLSNCDAIDSLEKLLTPKTRFLFLGHISGECNEHSIVEKMALNKLNELKRDDIKLLLMKQNTPLSPILLN